MWTWTRRLAKRLTREGGTMKTKRLAAGKYEIEAGDRRYLVEEVRRSEQMGRPQWNITPEGERFACDAADSLRDAKAMIARWHQSKPLIDVL